MSERAILSEAFDVQRLLDSDPPPRALAETEIQAVLHAPGRRGAFISGFHHDPQRGCFEWQQPGGQRLRYEYEELGRYLLARAA